MLIYLNEETHILYNVRCVKYTNAIIKVLVKNKPNNFASRFLEENIYVIIPKTLNTK